MPAQPRTPRSPEISCTTPPHLPQCKLPLPLATCGRSRLLDPALVDPHPWPPRHTPPLRFPQVSSSAHLARHGMLHNLPVRPIHGTCRYQLLCDPAPLDCARAAGLLRVPVVVRALSDRHARILALAGNLQRPDLHFLDQTDAIAGLIEEGATLEDIAADLAKPVGWVARRQRLQNLTPAWRKLAATPRGWASNWSAADFETVALLAPPSQDHLLRQGAPPLRRTSSHDELARILLAAMPLLSTFPWRLTDPTLHADAGACSTCPLRASRYPHLFDDLSLPGKGDRCLDMTCAAQKTRAFLAQRTARLAARYGTTILHLHLGLLPCVTPLALREWEVVEVSKRTPGARPALIVNGATAGAVRWVLPTRPSAAAAAEHP
jgi:hypothetical protein